MVEAPGDLPRDFNVRDLIHPHGDPVGLVNDDVGGLEYRVSQPSFTGC